MQIGFRAAPARRKNNSRNTACSDAQPALGRQVWHGSGGHAHNQVAGARIGFDRSLGILDKCLGLAAQSAIAAGDKAALGWVRHQDGTKAICEGNFSEARQSLEQALKIREELRDKAGAGVTRHNLKLVAPPTIPSWKPWKLLAGLGA